MSAIALRRWLAVHKWTSIVCTVFLLIACVTGLPLIFHDDLDRLTGHAPQLEAVAPGPRPGIDAAVDGAVAAHPGHVAHLVIFDLEEPDIASVRLAPHHGDGAPHATVVQPVDLRTAKAIAVPKREDGFVWMVFRLHSDLYAGLAGTLLLGVMGLMFVASVVSGIVVYRPFMRKLDFGTVRQDKAPRAKWLDLHNLLGIATLGWALVVGATGVVNTMAIPMLGMWQSGQLAELTAPYRALPDPPAGDRVPMARAIAVARQAAPGMTPFIVAAPGSMFSSRHHYAVYMRGGTPLTARLLKPALIDARTGTLTAIRDMPWYIRALFLSQPLHFGDYGGRILQFAWALLDIVTILVLVSGIRLLFRGRRATPGTGEAR